MSSSGRSTAALCWVLLSILPILAYAQHKDDTVRSSSKLYDFVMKTIDGKQRSLSEYKGKVLLIVNVASECGFTPQYAGLEAVYEKYKNEGFVILGFPSNDFGQQEPGTDNEIKTFCETNYKVTFDLFSKIEVKGSNQHPLYKYLTQECESPHEIKWNFNKFLVDRKGRVVQYLPSNVEPADAALTKSIETLIAGGS